MTGTSDESNVSVEQIDRAIAQGMRDGIESDDLALLWLAKAGLLGVEATHRHLQLVMGLSEAEALDTLARLSEGGFIDSDGATDDEARS